MKWLIPVTVVEYGRSAMIEADSKTDAIAKLRRCEWEYLTDIDHHTVTKSGPAKRAVDTGGG